jgi:hypothetical protein
VNVAIHGIVCDQYLIVCLLYLGFVTQQVGMEKVPKNPSKATGESLPPHRLES